MEQQFDIRDILNLIPAPCFCVDSGIIVFLNRAALQLSLSEGTPVSSVLRTGLAEYTAFESGTLYCWVTAREHTFGAAVHKAAGCDVFILDAEDTANELRALSLAAQQLREPLSKLKIAVDQLFAENPLADNAGKKAQLRQDLAQMNRLVGNMADAARGTAVPCAELVNIGAAFREIFDKISPLVASTGITMHCDLLSEDIVCLADVQELERAVLNIVSNALKFTPKDGCIEVSLTRRGKMLHLSIQDNGSGVSPSVRSTLFSRFTRQPEIEDNRCGIGLGMVLVRCAAAHHGGTVLVDQPEQGGTRVTMTIAIRQNSGNTFRSPALRIDYTGEQDHGLIELSECLPTYLYTDE